MGMVTPRQGCATRCAACDCTLTTGPLGARRGGSSPVGNGCPAAPVEPRERLLTAGAAGPVLFPLSSRSVRGPISTSQPGLLACWTIDSDGAASGCSRTRNRPDLPRAPGLKRLDDRARALVSVRPRLERRGPVGPEGSCDRRRPARVPGSPAQGWARRRAAAPESPARSPESRRGRPPAPLNRSDEKDAPRRHGHENRMRTGQSHHPWNHSSGVPALATPLSPQSRSWI